MRKTIYIALPLVLVLLAFAFVRDEPPANDRTFQFVGEEVILDFDVNKINAEGLELVLVDRRVDETGGIEEAHKQEEDLFMQFNVSFDVSLAKGLSTGVTLTGASSESQIEGEVSEDNLPGFPFLWPLTKKNSQGQPVLHFPFGNQFAYDNQGEPFIHMSYIGIPVPLIETLVIAEPITLPEFLSERFGLDGRIQFQPGSYALMMDGFWIAVKVVDTANLTLTKMCKPNDDGTGSFHITVVNDGPDDATGVVVTDDLPGAVTVTGSSGDGAFNASTGMWTIGDLPEGGAVSLWIDFTFEDQGQYLNRAEVTSEQFNDLGDADDECGFLVIGDRVVPDFVPEKSPGGITERGNRFAADLVLNKGVGVETATPGDMVSYTIKVENLGPHSTAKVQVTDHLPGCLTFVDAMADRGSYDVDTWIWDIGAIKVGELVELTITATVGQECDGTITNTAWVTRSTLPDPSQAFNLFDTLNPARENNHDDASFDVDTGTGRVLDGSTFALGQNYPNPFNPTTAVPFSLAEASTVSIKVYDLLGREVAVLVDGSMSAGVHEVAFDASALPTGMYLIRMKAAGLMQTQYVTLAK